MVYLVAVHVCADCFKSKTNFKIRLNIMFKVTPLLIVFSLDYNK